MLSISWPRWLVARFGKKACRRRPVERLRVQPFLEWLETRELLTTAAPFVLNQTQPTADPMASSGAGGYTPSQIRHAYGFDQISFNNGTVKGDGSGQTIAIVTAFNDPNILGDLNAFDLKYQLPSASLSVVGQTGGVGLPQSDTSGDWEAETALDVEWAHALAPGANLVLVEANSDDISDLLAAARTAADMPGVSVVSMSWGNAEFANETSYDGYFTTPAGHQGVTFVAASGDSGAPPIYPAVSPNVLSVGGTVLTLDSQGNYVSETAWSGSGGGISAYEPQPTYQQGVVTQSATQRTNPDVAFDADSATGLAVYNSYPTGGAGWTITAGTSAGAPAWAAIVAIANQGRALAGEATLDGPSQTLPAIYQMPSSNFHDIVSGSSTGTPPYSAGPGYDLVTGRGSPFADRVVYSLVGPTSSPLNGGHSPPPSPSSYIPPPSNGSNLLQDGGFETPSVGGNQLLNPTGSPWLFLGMAGIAGNGSTLTSGNGPAPGGVQVAFLYNQGGSILQSVSLAAGSYMLSFQAAQVGTMANSQEQIEVLVGGLVVATVTPGPSYTTYVGTFNLPSAGNYTVQFEGMAPGNGNGAVLDNVTLQGTGQHSGSGSSASPPPSPSPAPAPQSSSTNPAPSSTSSSGQGSSAPQDSFDLIVQSLISTLYDLLLSDLLFIQTGVNQFLQATNPSASIQLIPNLDGLSKQDAIGLLLQSWQSVEQLFPE